MSEQVSCNHPPNMCEAQYPLAALASHPARFVMPVLSTLFGKNDGGAVVFTMTISDSYQNCVHTLPPRSNLLPLQGGDV